MADADWRKKYADAIAAQLGRWDVSEIQGWIDKWSQQIAADVAADPHSWATADDFNNAVAKAREIVPDARRLPAHVRRLRERERRRQGRRRRALVRRLPRRRRLDPPRRARELLQRRRRQLQRHRRRRLLAEGC
jgi:hypothetical protein